MVMDMSKPCFSCLSVRHLPHLEVLTFQKESRDLQQLLIMGTTCLSLCFQLSFWTCCYASL